VEIQFDFSGMVNLVKGAAKIKACSITSGASGIFVGGEAHDFFAKEPAFDLTIDLQNLEPALINAFASLPPSIKLQGPLSGQASVKGVAAALNFSAGFNFDKAALSSPGTFVKPAGVPMGLKNSGGPERAKKFDDQRIQTLAGFF